MIRARIVAVAAWVVLLCACSQHEAPVVAPPEPKPYPAGMTTVLGEAHRPEDALGAADPVDCSHQDFAFATTVRQLPGGMRDVLSEQGSMADRVEDYNGSDVRRANLPTLHFDGAAVGQDRIFAVVNSGGIALVTRIWSFERTGSTWVGNRRWGGSEGSTLEGILAIACKQFQSRRHWTSGGLQVRCYAVPRSGLFAIEYEVAGRSGSFEVRGVDPRQLEPVHEPVIDARSGQAASPAQLAQLRETLRAARATMHDEDDCRFEADVFLSKLDAPGSGPASGASR